MKEAKDYNPSKDPRLINCKTECGNDKCYARRYGLFAEKTCPNFVEPKPITNAGRIRSMTDEELAEFLLNRDLNDVEKASKAVGFTYKVDRERCLANVIDWLKEEAVSDG